MQPLVPYLLGETHPQGKRLANVQKCVRTQDIDEVGDKTHDTFFEMLGNWSLGDYFKQEAIEWSYEFLTSKEEGLGLDPQRLYVTVFEGDHNAPRDEESYNIWKNIFERAGVTGERIYYLGAKSNWWEVGQTGPCGPDTEMFYDLTGKLNQGLTKEEYLAADDRQEVVEVWNDVFMEYEKKDGVVVGKLKNSNVDTGSGLERVVMAVQGKDNIFETDLFSNVMSYLGEHSQKTEGNFTTDNITEFQRIIADHIRTVVFLMADGVQPGNKDREYIVRRLIRRAVRRRDSLGLTDEDFIVIAKMFIEQYQAVYPNLKVAENHIINSLKEEQEKSEKIFNRVLQFRLDLEMIKSHRVIKNIRKGVPILNENGKVSGKYVYENFKTYGVSSDVSEEIIKELGFELDKEELETEIKKHQDLSRAGAEQKFKGGLADHSEETVKYHTATHLLNQALHDVLGDHVDQKGSNITTERLRFDFSHTAKMTPEEIAQVEQIVNDKIKADLPVQAVVLPKAEAEKTGARHAFADKYGDEVNIYFIGDTLESAYSKEFCGGPHVEHTGTLGVFKIAKEEAVAAGIRRIKAVLQ